MRTTHLELARRRRGWSQKEAARRLGLSQPYLSMLESGKRSLTRPMARKMMRAYQLPPTVLPPREPSDRSYTPDNQALAEDLGKLGYPGFAYLRTHRQTMNPAEVLLTALSKDDLEPRLTEALPWLLLRYGDGLDTRWLLTAARVNNLQNRLGFVASLARRVAEACPQFQHRVHTLRQLEQELYGSRLAQEDTLCQKSLPQRKRQWLAQNRPPEAAYWNLLTDWRPEVLSYDRLS